MTAATFGAVAAALYAAHHFGDYWLQTQHQADHKGDRNRAGWAACIRHVATYTAATAAATGIVWARFDLPITWAGFAAGQLISAGTHLIIDRRYPLRALAKIVDRFAPGKVSYYDNGGAAHLDQSAHFVCLFLAALATTWGA